MAERKYYKWSLKWSFHRSDHHVFYCPNNSGYTTNLNKAGLYSEEEISDCENVIESEEDYQAALKNRGYHPLCAVPVDKVELLGRKEIAVRH